jgi:succinoglycan biosynthesis protein ExoO
MPTPAQSADEPMITVVMAAFNVGDYLHDALTSVREQTVRQMEIIVVDDGSTDATPQILADHARDDHRIRVLSADGLGPAGARNLAFEHARGRWVAIVDSDDLILPDRFALMIEAGDRRGADAVADNLVAFYESDKVPDHEWIEGALWPSERLLTFEDLIRGGLGKPPRPELGYLKPIFRRERLAAFTPPYREDLRIGEDFDLMARWLASGRTYLYLPAAGYRYRRRPSSISYRLTAAQTEQMSSALSDLDRNAPCFDAAAVQARAVNLQNMTTYAHRVTRLKRFDLSALAPLAIDGDYRKRLFTSVREGLSNRLSRNG